MIKIDYLKYLLLFLILVVLQILIFNNFAITIGSFYSIPIIYIYFILTLPFNTKSMMIILLGFLLGLTVDVFCDTLGINAAATTFIAFLRQPVLNIFLRDKEAIKNKIPCIHFLGWSVYLKYSILLTSIHIVLISFLEYFDFYNWSIFIPYVIGSIILSVFIIVAIDLLFNNSKSNE